MSCSLCGKAMFAIRLSDECPGHDDDEYMVPCAWCGKMMDPDIEGGKYHAGPCDFDAEQDYYDRLSKGDSPNA